MKLLKNQIQNPGSDVGRGGRRIPCGILVARPQVLRGRGAGFGCPAWAGALVCLWWWCAAAGQVPTHIARHSSLPGCLALEFLELSVVQFLSLQDQRGRRERWKPREQGQLRLETCHQVNGQGTSGKGNGVTLEASAPGFRATVHREQPLPALCEESNLRVSPWTAHTVFPLCALCMGLRPDARRPLCVPVRAPLA